jgi:signal peptidase I
MQLQNHRLSRTKKVIHADKRDLPCTVLNVLLVPATIFMVWKAVSVATDSRCPIVVVISQSMEPAFRRGDLLLLQNRKHIIEVGDIPVCWFPGNPLPMVHRAISVTYTESCSDFNIIV